MAIKKITVLYGGQSSEREVSLESGKDIYHSLKVLGYEAQLIDYPKNFFLEQFSQEAFIFIALHGAVGESGELHQILQQNYNDFSIVITQGAGTISRLNNEIKKKWQ